MAGALYLIILSLIFNDIFIYDIRAGRKEITMTHKFIIASITGVRPFIDLLLLQLSLVNAPGLNNSLHPKSFQVDIFGQLLA